MARRPHLVVAALALASLIATQGRGEVFLRLQKTPRVVFEQVGGSEVQTSKITVNGADGEMRVHSFAKPFAEVCAEIARALKIDALSAQGGGDGVMFDWPDGSCRAIVLSVGIGATMAFTIDTPANDARPVWPWGDMQNAGMALSFSAISSSGFSMASGSFDMAPSAIRASLDGAILGAGFVAVTPAGGDVSTAIFAKDGEIAVRTVLPASGACAVFRRRAIGGN